MSKEANLIFEDFYRKLTLKEKILLIKAFRKAITKAIINIIKKKIRGEI